MPKKVTDADLEEAEEVTKTADVDIHYVDSEEARLRKLYRDLEELNVRSISDLENLIARYN